MARPIRLAILHPEIETMDEYHGGALARWTAEISRRAPPDFDVTIVSKPPRASPYRGLRARIEPIRSSVLDRLGWARRYAIRWYFPEARRHLLHRPYDVLHIHARPQWVLPLRRAGLDIPILLHLQNDHLGFWPAHELQELLDATSLVLTCSDFISRLVAGTEPTSPRPSGPVTGDRIAKIVTLHNGVDVARFLPLPQPRERGEGFRIAYLGRIVPSKAPHLTMRSVLRLRREGFSLRMLLIGAHAFGKGAATPYIRELRSLAAEDPAAFRFLGYVHHRRLPAALQLCDAYVHACTWDEPFALATAEAMACGLVPIVSRRGANCEVAGEAALSFEPTGSADGLTDHLRMLMSDPSRLDRLGSLARRRAVENFSWDLLASRYFTSVRGIVGA